MECFVDQTHKSHTRIYGFTPLFITPRLVVTSLGAACVTLRSHSFQLTQTEPTHGLAGIYSISTMWSISSLSVYLIVTQQEQYVKRKLAVKVTFLRDIQLVFKS